MQLSRFNFIACWLVMMLSFLAHNKLFSQNFVLEKEKPVYKRSFQFVGNLIVLRLKINDSAPMNFILDSGSGYTIITSLEAIEELKLKQGKEVNIKGLGTGYSSTAYFSRNNKVSIGKIKNNSADIVLLFNSNLDFSQRLGIPIHGIIGYELFKEFVIDINYKKKSLKFYEPEYFYSKNQSKLDEFKSHDLVVKNGKSYLQLNGKFPNGKQKNLDLLIDTGSWDALWLFEKEEIKVPEKNIDDFLGYGLSGPVNGKRSKIKTIEIASEVLELPTTSFPDSISIGQLLSKDSIRDGSIGSEVLRRFNVIFDYPNEKVFFKKNNSIKEKFYYNMSGMELAKTYPLVPVYEVVSIRENSPAYLAGLRKGDIIQEINNAKPDQISLNDIYKLFRKAADKKITISYTRGDTNLKYASFKLKPIL